MDDSIIPWIMAGVSVLGALTALITVVIQRKNAKEDNDIKHSGAVMGSYGELVDRLEKRLDAQGGEVEDLKVLVERQGGEITTLKIELRDRDDQIKLLTLDRDDLITLMSQNDVRQPPLRTV